jgi:hypothetical protein
MGVKKESVKQRKAVVVKYSHTLHTYLTNVARLKVVQEAKQNQYYVPHLIHPPTFSGEISPRYSTYGNTNVL